VRTEDFDYALPPELIATQPVTPRDASRLMVYRRSDQSISHHRINELPELLSADDTLIFNNSRVIPARLRAHDSKGRDMEVMLLEPKGDRSWRALAKPGKRIKTRFSVSLKDGTELMLERTPEDEFLAHFPPGSDFYSWLETVGEPPIPPYFKRKADLSDRDRYQTVYAETPGSVAAPTAGLHFTPQLLNSLASAGIEQHFVTLHVGYGTFAPISVKELSEHRMHFESYEIEPGTFAAIQRKHMEGKRIIAVGTTSLRTLESIPLFGPAGRTNLFITPGYHFAFVGGLLTNFHLPQSSLYVLVAALIGLNEVRRCYHEAIQHHYRFYSYGDAMLVL